MRVAVASAVAGIGSGVRNLVEGRRRPAAPPTQPSPPDGRGVDPSSVRLEPVGPERREVVHNLVQLYRHDLSEFRGYELDERGTYAYDYLDAFLGDPDREAYLVRVDDSLAGFVFTHRLPDGVWQVSELFVVRPHRRSGVGRVALTKTFELHPGRWMCFVDELNEASRRLCDGVLEERGEDTKVRRRRNRLGFIGTARRFTIAGPDRN